MDKNELLKYLICEIDLVMHDKDYRFENEDGTWYSRESCKNLTNEEVFEELKSELRQLAKIEDDFADLEAKLAESEKYIELLLEEKAGYLDLISGYADKCKELKHQLAKKDAEVQSWKDGTMVVKLGKLEEQLAEKNELFIATKWKVDDLEKQLAEKDEEETKRMEDFEKGCQEYYSSGKYKKDFAIDELEKVKEIIARHTQELWTCENDDIDIVLYEEIDQQIKSLKGEK